MIHRLSKLLDHHLFDPTRLDALVFFRIFLGSSMILYFSAWWQHRQEWLTLEGFHSQEALKCIYRIIHLPLLPDLGLSWFGIVFFGSLILFVLGIALRASALAAWICIVYVSLVDPISAFTLNKIFILSLVVFIFSPHVTFRLPTGCAWPLRCLQFLLISLYFFAGWKKAVFGDWLNNSDVLWSQVQGVYRTDFAAFLLRHLPKSIWTFAQWSALLFELLAPLIFFKKNLRKLGFIWGFAFQLLIALTMDQLIYFSLTMLSFYVLFFETRRINSLRNLFSFKIISKQEDNPSIREENLHNPSL